jgi:hypothetical protein
MFENLHVPLHYHNIQRMCCQNHVTNFTGFEALRSPFSTAMLFVLHPQMTSPFLAEPLYKLESGKEN